MESLRILIIEDENLIRRTLRRKLEREGYRATEADCGVTARQCLRNQAWDVALLDINLPDINGLDLLAEIHEMDPDLPVIMMTGQRAIEKVVTAMKRGAFDYLTKPFNLDEVVVTLQKALEVTEMRRELRGLRASRVRQPGFKDVIAKSPAMTKVLEMARTIAESEAETVLILGESGTGKNLLARAIHQRSKRSSKPFMEITCTALPETLLESELFGHERGAFTDARTSKKGLCELAHHGTLFLDEIGDMSLSMQAKLLGFLERRTFRRVGGTRNVEVDLRVITATNQPMDKLIAEKRFREDLYYRLNVLEMTIPPLRERPEDIALLARTFIDGFNQKFKKTVHGIDREALAAMKTYAWPGNVRELRNAMERAMILTKQEQLTLEDLPLKGKPTPHAPAPNQLITLPEGGVSLDTVENELVRQALEKTRGNQTKAAKLLSISRDQLRYRMKQFNLF